MKSNRHLAAFYDGSVGIVMDLDGYRLYRVPPDLAQAVEQNVDHPNLSSLYAQFGTIIAAPSERAEDYSIGKVVLHVAHACNLRCSYCYADFGTYGLPRKIMTSSMAIDSLQTIYQERGWVPKILFFGGEPTLNTRVMNDVYDFFETTYGRHPSYGTVSNLTIVNSRVIDTVNRLGLSVTASFDGPQEVNDKYRVTVTGQGTHDTILRNISRLKAATGQPLAIEITYSDAHLSQRLSPWDVMDYTYEKTGVEYMILAFVHNTDAVNMQVESDEFLHVIEDYARETVHRIVEGRKPYDVNLGTILATALNPDPMTASFWCTTGIKTLAVTPDGDLHPCQIFVGHGMGMGNITKERLGSVQLPLVQAELMSARKDHFDACNHCYGKWTCSACTGGLYREKGSLYPQSAWHCGSHRALMRAALLEAAHLSRQGWRAFLQGIAEILGADVAMDEEHV